MNIQSWNKSIIAMILATAFTAPGFAYAESGKKDAETDDAVVFYQYTLEERLRADGSGHYNVYLDEMMSGIEQDWKIIYAPIKRADRLFLRDQKACLFPGSITMWRSSGEGRQDVSLVESDPVDLVSVQIFFSKQQQAFKDLTELKGKTVGHMLGTTTDKMLEPYDVNMFYSQDEDELLQMLNAGRLDAIMGIIPDTLLAMERIGVDNVITDPALRLVQVGITIVCKDFDGVDALMTSFNNNIHRLNKSGRTAEILAPFGEAAELD